jgi:purine-binding chemotaxis protein CheW
VETGGVRELLRAVAIQPLPGASALVEGVINLRGTVVAVLDVRAWLGLPARGVEPSEHLVIFTAGGRTLAVRTDRALGLSTLDAGAVESACGPAAEGGGPVEVAKAPEGLLPLLDLKRLAAAAFGPRSAVAGGDG